MQCRRCGKGLGDSMRCVFCGYENTEGNVREMTRTERTLFDGVTIDAGEDDKHTKEESFRGQQRRSYSYSTRGTYINFTESNILGRVVGSFARALVNGNRLAQIAALLIGVAFAALVFFVALPILFVLLAIGITLLVIAKILN